MTLLQSFLNYPLFANRKILKGTIIGFALLCIGLFFNFYSGVYATESQNNPVTDIILSNIRVFDVDGIFVYGPYFLWAFVIFLCLKNLRYAPFVLKSVALFLLVRSLFVSLTHIGPFPDHIRLTSNLITKFTFGGDLFFSGHTGSPFLMALLFWENIRLRVLFVLTSILFGVVVLMGHLHYSIDVLAAFFITYTIFHISRKVFRKDYELFHQKNRPSSR